MMSDYDFVKTATTMLAEATVVNKFTETVWVAVDRQDWDKFQAALTEEKENEMA
jgi:hypothetical protein